MFDNFSTWRSSNRAKRRAFVLNTSLIIVVIIQTCGPQYWWSCLSSFVMPYDIARGWGGPPLEENIQIGKSHRWREVGWLLLQLKKDHSITSLADALHPLQFQKVVSFVRQVSGFDHQTNSFSAPSLALKLDHSLKMCHVTSI